MLESHFNSEYSQILKNTHFEEHLLTVASEKVFMKLRKTKIHSSGVLILHLKIGFFQHQYQKQVHDRYFMIGFP